MYIYLSIYLSTYLSIYLSIYLYIHTYIHTHIHTYVDGPVGLWAQAWSMKMEPEGAALMSSSIPVKSSPIVFLS